MNQQFVILTFFLEPLASFIFLDKMGKATIATVLLLIVVFLALSEAKRGFWNGFMNGRPLRDHYARLVVGEEAAADCDTNPGAYNVIVKNHTQKLDHFDPSNTNTWQQVRTQLLSDE